MSRIVVVGSVNMDLVVKAPRIPRPGETVPGATFFTAPGGKGANQAVAAARLGSEVYFVGRLGNDAFGRELADSLAAAGVRQDFVGRDPEAASGVALITVDSQGENSIVVASGANARLSLAEVRAAERALAGAQAVLTQLEIPPETVAEVASLAARHHVPLVLNPAPARPLPDKLLQSVTTITPNEVEAEMLTGVAVTDPPSAEAAAVRLLGRGVQVVVVTLGQQGALLVKQGGVVYLPAHRVSVVDTTAAGDAFSAALAVAFAEGRSWAEAARFANAAAALSVTRMGAQPSMPTRAEVERFLQERAP